MHQLSHSATLAHCRRYVRPGTSTLSSARLTVPATMLTLLPVRLTMPTLSIVEHLIWPFRFLLALRPWLGACSK